ncbi:hypothetical protein MMC26_001839 [Xylographa opegraphella]|nr:hypothetical protein [Xylographa opegraphella]
MEIIQKNLMLALPVPLDENHVDTVLGSSQALYSRLTPEIWKKIFSFLVPEHLRIPRYTRGWMGEQWKQLIKFLGLRAVFGYVQDDLYQTLCAECTFSVADGVRHKNAMTVVPAIERAIKFFGHIGLKHFRHVKSIQFIITGTTTGNIRKSEVKRMLDALETLLQYCSPSMKLKDAQLRCHEFPVEYYCLDGGTRTRISGYVVDGPKPHMTFIGSRNKNLKAFGRGPVSSDRVNTALMHRHEDGHPIDFMKTLPPELRRKIYNMLLADVPQSYDVTRKTAIWKRNGYDFTSLLAVNAEMRHEVLRSLYSKYWFCFDAQLFFTSLDFMDMVGSANAANICHVIITFEIYPDNAICTIKPLLSRLPNYSTLCLDASYFNCYTVIPQRASWSYAGQPELQGLYLLRAPNTGKILLDIRVVIAWTLLRIFYSPHSYDPRLPVVRQALQASIDGKECAVNAEGILSTWWPAETQPTEKSSKAKRIKG